MRTSVLRNKVIEEINRVPEDKLKDIYEFIHFFNLRDETNKNTPEDIMQFAGCWQDMPDGDFKEFLSEITARRKNAFSGREPRESFIN